MFSPFLRQFLFHVAQASLELKIFPPSSTWLVAWILKMSYIETEFSASPLVFLACSTSTPFVYSYFQHHLNVYFSNYLNSLYWQPRATMHWEYLLL